MERVIPLDSIADIEPLRDLPPREVETGAFGTEFDGLLWVEVGHIIRWTRMTIPQATVFTWYCKGLTTQEIAFVHHCRESTVKRLLGQAVKKARTYPCLGLLTVLVECFGLAAVNEYLWREAANRRRRSGGGGAQDKPRRKTPLDKRRTVT